MGIAFELRNTITITHEVSKKIKDFLLGGSSPQPRLSRSASSSSGEDSLDLDAENPAGVANWDPLLEKQDVVVEPEDPLSRLMSSCPFSIFSSLDHMVIMNGKRIVVLRQLAKTANSGEAITMEIICLKELDHALDMIEDEYLCASCMFGIGSRRVSSPIDCILLAVGTSTGLVAFLTETGSLLFYERFAAGTPIKAIHFDQLKRTQHLTVVTKEEIISISPFSLHAAVSAAKTSIAKGEKTATEISDNIEIQCERLTTSGGGGAIRHVECTGLEKPSSFDQYVSASLASYNQRAERPVLPHYATFFVTSERLFSSFAWYDDTEGDKIWTEALKMGKSLIPSFGFRKFLGIDQTPARRSVLSLSQRSCATRGVIGDTRIAERIAASPSPRRLVAVVDQAARVILIDVDSRQIVRLWKGYRDASVSWLTSSEKDENGRIRRRAMFLVILAPRRALLEVWSVEGGSRVGAMHVDPDGLLLSGTTEKILCGQNLEDSGDTMTYFVDSKDRIFELIVPFHLALLRTESNDQHDQILINKLPTSTLEPTAFLEVFTMLRSQKARRQLLLQSLHLAKDHVSLMKMIERVSKLDTNCSLGELPNKILSAITMYARMMEYSSRREKIQMKPLHLPFNTETTAIIQGHLKRGDESIELTPISIGFFLSLLDWNSASSTIMNKNVADQDVMRLGQLIYSSLIECCVDAETFDDMILDKLQINMDDLVQLMSIYFLGLSKPVGEAMLENVISWIVVIGARNKAYIDVLEKAAVESTSSSKALLLLVAVMLAKNRIELATKKNTLEEQTGEDDPMRSDHDESMDASEDWETFDPRAEHADCTVQAFHIGYLLGELKSGGCGGGVPYSRMLNGSGGFIREQIGSWAAEKGLDVAELRERLVDDEDTVMSVMMRMLPMSMALPLLHADTAWENMSLWSKERMEKVQALKLSISHLKEVEDDRLRHGVARLMWENLLADTFKGLVQLVEKTGRAPKEREARQLLNLPYDSVVDFLEQCQLLLGIIMDSVRDSPVPTDVRMDHLLEVAQAHPPLSVRNTSSSGRDSLANLAMRQTLSNYHLVLHHSHLALTARLQLSAGVRYHPLSTLFDQVGQRAFFQILDSHPLIPLDRVNDVLLEKRHAFITKIAELGSDEDRIAARVLAGEWNLTIDNISLMQAVCHLRAGEDALASRELAVVTKDDHLASRIARLLAARILRLAQAEKTILTTAHSSFLNELAAEEALQVEWPTDDWKAAVRSLAKLTVALNLPKHRAAPFGRLDDVTSQYWMIRSI